MDYTIIYFDYPDSYNETLEPCASKDYAIEQVAKYKKETGKHACWVYSKNYIRF